MRAQGTHLIAFPGPDVSLLDYITLYVPYLRHATLNMLSVDVEVKPGMGFLWPASDYTHIQHRSEVDEDLYQSVIDISRVPYCDVEGFKVALSEEMIYATLEDPTIEKRYKACIFPSKEMSRSTWCQLISSFGLQDEVVIVDESCYDPNCQTWDVPATDMRGMDLELTLDVIRQSEVVIGPSSGIIALATYSGVPFITYGGVSNNPWKDHYHYNPFETFGMSFRGIPSDSQLEEAVAFMFSRFEEDDKEEPTYEEKPNEADVDPDDWEEDEGYGS